MNLVKRFPPRFILFFLVTMVATPVAAYWAGWHHGSLVGFDIGAFVFLASLGPLVRRSDVATMRQHCAQNDPNGPILLTITVVVSVVILAAVALELGAKGSPSDASLALIVVTLILSWFFTNSVFALHYAHMYYRPGPVPEDDFGGIDFPGTPEPNYWDFIYFSYCLGMTYQTSDSNITSGRIRRIVTAQCLMSFVFSIGVIAFTINVLGSGRN
jgi:uncharacterized membrane protein